MATPALMFVIVGHHDHRMSEADLLQRPEGYAERGSTCIVRAVCWPRCYLRKLNSPRCY